MLDGITQAVLDLKGGTEVPEVHSLLFGFKDPKDRYETLCTTEDFGGKYVWALDDSIYANNEKRKICKLDEYLAHAAKVKEYMKFYKFTFDEPFDLKTWNVWNELNNKLETPKIKYWDGVSVPQTGEIVKHLGVECVIEYITSIGTFILVNKERKYVSLANLDTMSPVKTKKDLVVDSVWEKLTNTGVSSDTDKNILHKLYDLNLLKEDSF